jgi:hypothetical protein
MVWKREGKESSLGGTLRPLMMEFRVFYTAIEHI